MGSSVTNRIKQVKQPRGGYIKPNEFSVECLGVGIEELNPIENVHPSLIGLTVDYLTRYLSGAPLDDAFKISILGASNINEFKKASLLLKDVKGVDDISIINAVKLTNFDAYFRVGPIMYKPLEDINPDSATIQNIRTMVNRSLYFLECYGPKVLDGFTFENGYTNIVSKGDGDFITEDTIWDFKVSNSPIKKEHTLQLLMYWRMGLRSIYPEFQNIQYLGIYNPRKNEVHRLAVKNISEDVIVKVDREVIGYKE